MDAQWRREGETRCETAVGEEQGRCLPIADGCADAAPGDAVCVGNDRVLCGADLTATTAMPCASGQRCTLGDDGAQCSECGAAEAGQCEACTSVADCSSSPTATCSAGICTDPTWGCLGQFDPREAANSSDTASFKIKVLYAYAQNGAAETGVKNLTWRVCASNDPLCEGASNPAVNATYGEDNYLVINGLESGRNYRLQLRGFHPSSEQADLELIPTEYLMYRTVVGETVEPKPIIMFEEAVRDALASMTGVPVDESLGMLLVRVYDCSDMEVAGVMVASSRATAGCMGDCATTVFYQNASGVPDPGATETSAAGRAGILNMNTDVLSRITLTRSADNKKITSFAVTPRANWITYAHFWPWDYGTGSD